MGEIADFLLSIPLNFQDLTHSPKASLRSWLRGLAQDVQNQFLTSSQYQLALLTVRDYLAWHILNDECPSLTLRRIKQLTTQVVDQDGIGADSILTPHEVKWLMDRVSRPFMESMLSLLSVTGLRTGEVCRLSPDQFHQDENGEIFYLDLDGERACDRRRHTISQSDLTPLENYCQQYGRSLTDKSSKPIFRSPTGNQLVKKTIYNRLQRFSSEVGFGRLLTATKFRNSYAFWHFLAGKSLVTIKEELGIGEIATLESKLGPYAHLRDDHLNSADDETSLPFLPTST